ncbi:MAG: hypothetical protein AABY22_31240 [Nanoarchaeota archaeon]
MPSVRKNESESEYVSRCTGDTEMVREFSDQKKRIAVCYSLYKQSKKKLSKSSAKIINWDDTREEFLESNDHIIIEP